MAEENVVAGAVIRIPESDVARDPSQVMLFDPVAPRVLSFSTFDRRTEEGFMLLSRMKNDSKQALADMVNSLICVRNFYTQPVESTNANTGEVTWYPWTVLEDVDGKLYTCGSNGVFGSLSDALAYRPQTPWNPPLTFKVITRSLKSGRKVMALLYVAQVKAEGAEQGEKHGKKK